MFNCQACHTEVQNPNAELMVRPQFFLTTIRDGLAFLLAVPIFKGVDWAQAQGWLPVLIHLP